MWGIRWAGRVAMAEHASTLRVQPHSQLHPDEVMVVWFMCVPARGVGIDRRLRTNLADSSVAVDSAYSHRRWSVSFFMSVIRVHAQSARYDDVNM